MQYYTVRQVPEMSMCAGEFLDVYNVKNEQGQWDCVMTCFFIDTAPNVFEYIEVHFFAVFTSLYSCL